MLQAPRIVRWTLPALLLTLVIGGYLIVSSGLRDDKSEAGSSRQTTTTKRKHKPRHAKVRRGDTPSSIAHRAHLTVVELLQLNPNVDPRLLRPGQRLKISR